MVTNTPLNRALLSALLLGRPVPNDQQRLSDAVMNAALEGSHVLTGEERRALQGSPLTLRRFRHLSLARRKAHTRPTTATNDATWDCSLGLLLAADSGHDLNLLVTEDRCWSLHFVDAGLGRWSVVLALDPDAPFAAPLIESGRAVVVRDGNGQAIACGPLDVDGELEANWPFAEPPARHLPACGGGFSVEPMVDRV
jgi:hypothetical protein